MMGLLQGLLWPEKRQEKRALGTAAHWLTFSLLFFALDGRLEEKGRVGNSALRLKFLLIPPVWDRQSEQSQALRINVGGFGRCGDGSHFRKSRSVQFSTSVCVLVLFYILKQLRHYIRTHYKTS